MKPEAHSISSPICKYLITLIKYSQQRRLKIGKLQEPKISTRCENQGNWLYGLASLLPGCVFGLASIWMVRHQSGTLSGGARPNPMRPCPGLGRSHMVTDSRDPLSL